MSSTRVIFTYKRKRLSSCSGVGHTDVCPEFSQDVQVGKDQPDLKEGLESTEDDVMHQCHGKEQPECSFAQLYNSCGDEEKSPSRIFGSSSRRKMQLCANESSEENKCIRSGECNSPEAWLQDATAATKISSFSDLDSSCLVTDQDIKSGVVSQSMDEPDLLSNKGCTSTIEVAKSKLTAPLLTFSRRLKRKTDLGGSVVLGELPTNEGAAAGGERKTTWEEGISIAIDSNKSSLSCDVSLHGMQLTEKSVNLKTTNAADIKILPDQSSEKITDNESRSPCQSKNYGANIPVLRPMAKSCIQDKLVMGTSTIILKSSVETSIPIASGMGSTDAPETTNLHEDKIVVSLNDEVLASCDNTGKTDGQLASQQAQSSSGGSQLTSSDSSDVKICAGKTVVSSAPMDSSRPPSGGFVIDCNVIPESDLQEIESDFVQHSSAIVGNCGKVMEEAEIKREGVELLGDTDLKTVESPSTNVAWLCSDGHTPLAADKTPKPEYLQLFSEDGHSSLAASTSKNCETGCSKAQQNVAFALDGGKDLLGPTKASAMLGSLSLDMEPVYEGQTSQHGSGVHLFPDQNVRFRDFIQNPVFHPFPDHSSSISRHKVLFESYNTRATELRGIRNIYRLEHPTMWSEEELDSLWIGIRRHGRGNWHAMLLDPCLRFAPWRVARDLADQWERELYKLLSGQYLTADKCVKPPEMYSLGSHKRFNHPKAGYMRKKVSTETELSLGDLFGRRRSTSSSRSNMQRQPHMHVTIASNLGNYSSSSFNTSQTSVVNGDGPPGMGLGTFSHAPHWLQGPSGIAPRLFEPSPSLVSTQLQTEGLQPVHPFSEPSGACIAERNLDCCKFPDPAVGESGSSLVRKRRAADDLIVIDSDASSEGTISDDHNNRNQLLRD